MSSPEVIYACRWLIRDTLRQALANGVLWVMLGASGVVILFCLSISITGGEPLETPGEIGLERPGVDREGKKLPGGRQGYIHLAFGAWKLALPRDGRDMVHYILLVVGEGVFGVVGTLLALVLTAGFIPDFLQPGNAIVLLSKPTPRWVLFLGKYLGVLALLGIYVSVFVIGTWLALGLRTGFWVNSYLWGVPLMVLQIASIYSFSAFLGVCTGNYLASVFGSVIFWFMCSGMNMGRHFLVALKSSLPPQSPLLGGLVEIGYWVLPKPVDLNMILHAAVESGQAFPQLQQVQELGAFHPVLSVVSSLAFIVMMVLLSAQQLASKDY